MLQAPEVFVEVIVPLAVPRAYTYVVPEQLSEYVDIGSRVVVPFGRQKVVTGVISGFTGNVDEDQMFKPLIDVLDDIPHLNEYQLKLFHWMSEYYMCTIGEVFNNALPSGLKLSNESHIQLNPGFVESGSILTDKEHLLISALHHNDSLSFKEVEKILQIKSYVRVIKSLIDKGAVLIFDALKDKYTPKKVKYIRIHPGILEKGKLEETLNNLEHKEKQLNWMLAYLQVVPVFEEVSINAQGVAKTALQRPELSESSLKTLIKNNIFESFEKIVSRFDDLEEGMDTPPELTPEQSVAKDKILSYFEKNQPVLLHGVTGSGKTEIYINLIHDVIESGGQVLYLLPEIALTTQIVQRLRKSFGDKMGVYHSKYNDNERVEVWRGILSGKFSVIVGVRSAIFLPFDNLDLIIVDEEHENTYKQFDPAPRYQARDVALYLSKLHHASILLGTATPSVESYYLAQSGKMGLVKILGRYGKAHMPEIHLVDISRSRRERTMKGDLSPVLHQRIAESIQRKEQVIIFQNRRGYANYLTCLDCGWIPKCDQCAVSLTYHMYSNQIKCHYCGFKEHNPTKCPECNSSRIKTIGIGTEKVEEDLQLFFGEANIMRMDLDTTRIKGIYQKIIDGIDQGEIDILVGTQMVTKGLDFKNVTLVGVLDADRMMFYPDFRSFERTFQLITQVSGRAGRSEKKGEVVIQTADPGQRIFQWIIHNQYEDFYKSEISERQAFRYPPFFRLIKLTIKHKQKKPAQQGAMHLYQLMVETIGHSLLTEPHEPVIGKIRNYYLMEILVRLPRDKVDLKRLKKFLQECAFEIQQHKTFRQLLIQFDVDPY